GPARQPRPGHLQVHDHHARAEVLKVASAATVVCAVALITAAALADTTRFIPWKEPKTPPLALSDLAGSTRTLADFRGKVVIVNFWATGCEPCRAEMPSMQKLQER